MSTSLANSSFQYLGFFAYVWGTLAIYPAYITCSLLGYFISSILLYMGNLLSGPMWISTFISRFNRYGFRLSPVSVLHPVQQSGESSHHSPHTPLGHGSPIRSPSVTEAFRYRRATISVPQTETPISSQSTSQRRYFSTSYHGGADFVPSMLPLPPGPAILSSPPSQDPPPSKACPASQHSLVQSSPSSPSPLPPLPPSPPHSPPHSPPPEVASAKSPAPSGPSAVVTMESPFAPSTISSSSRNMMMNSPLPDRGKPISRRERRVRNRAKEAERPQGSIQDISATHSKDQRRRTMSRRK